MARRKGGEKTKKGGLFDDLSMAQVLAGALAAVTSMMLASRIGIAGSVIGVAVGSIVSAVASQLYKKFFMASAEKIRDLTPGEDEALLQDGEMATQPAASAAETSAMDLVDAQGQTQVFSPRAPGDAVEGNTKRIEPLAVHRSKTPRVEAAASRGDATAQRVQRMRSRKRKVQRRVVAVSVVSALMAVGVSALMIELVTTGQGVGNSSNVSTYSQGKAVQSEDGGSTSGGTPDAESGTPQNTPSGDTSQDTPASPDQSGSGSTPGATDGSQGTGGSASSGGSQSGTGGSGGNGGSGGTDGSGGSGSTEGGGQTDSGGSAGSDALPDSGGSSSGSGSDQAGSGSSSSASGSASAAPSAQ